MIWAVHIADGILTPTWLAAGFLGAGLLSVLGAWRLRDEDLPRLALGTAAFFVASFIHVPAPPISVHLLLNGLLGVVLGRRAGLAIVVALFLQAVLARHGGYYSLGINACVMALPALAAWLAFAMLLRLPWLDRSWFRIGLVALCSFLWVLGLVFGVALMALDPTGQVSNLPVGRAVGITFHPAAIGAALVVSLVIGLLEKRLEPSPQFPLGLFVGETAVLLTAVLNALVLVWGGVVDWPTLVLLSVVPHAFIAALEGLVVGFTVAFLARVKPELLNGLLPEKTQWLADSVS